MGNVLGVRPQPNVPFHPNIPVNAANQNNLNRPHSVQMQDMVLNFGIPLFYIAAYAIRELRSAKQKELIERQTANIADLNHQLTNVKEQVQKFSQQQASRSLLASLQAIDEEENVIFEEKLNHLKYYEEGLETILDIRCSMFKPRQQRQVIEEDLINSLPTKDLSYVVKYSQLKDIYTHDHLFCGRRRKENGKLRQLYVEQWRQKLEMEKDGKILRRLKDLS